MAAAMKSRSSDGCWTCRLRRKKCDEGHPICANCITLEIDCLYGDAKPEWMDSGERQKERAEQLKAEIKRNTSWRREKRYFQVLENGMEDLNIINGYDAAGNTHDLSHAAGGGGGSGSETTGGSSAPPSSQSESVMGNTPPGSSAEWPSSSDRGPSSTGDATTPPSGDSNILDAAAATSPPLQAMRAITSMTTADSTAAQERELQAVMVYLDYVFPFLFPFYRPPLLHFGRGWLLVLLTRNKALLHSALSLSSYMFSMVFDAALEGHQLCKEHSWAELQHRVQLGLRELQADMFEINVRGVAGHLNESALVMESIIHLLCFEVTIAHTDANWQMHLDAALALFEQIIEHHGRVRSSPDGPVNWKSILYQLSDTAAMSAFEGAPLNTDQAAMEFFSAVLLHVDVVTSTVLGRTPRLHKYHPQLLTYNSTAESQGPPSTSRIQPTIQLEQYTGIHNWVMLSIGNIAALDAWKKECQRTGQMSTVQLVSRARDIEGELRTHIALLDRDVGTCLQHSNAEAAKTSGPDRIPNRMPSQHSQAFDAGLAPIFGPAGDVPGALWATRIWAQAALTYLCVVLSGWQPASEEIHQSNTRTLELLRGVPAPSSLRSVAWPLCVAGCLVCPGQEAEIRAMVGAVGSLEVYGTLREAMAIMENVWAHRGEFETASWDLASCFTSMNKTPLFM